MRNEGLVFHDTARAIRIINGLLHSKNKIFQTFTENLPTIFRKIIFHEISPKSFQNHFPKVFIDFHMSRKFPENSPRIS